MNKELSEMTLEELWKLFPISLVEHRAIWKNDYLKIQAELLKLLPISLFAYKLRIFSFVLDNFTVL